MERAAAFYAARDLTASSELFFYELQLILHLQRKHGRAGFMERLGKAMREPEKADFHTESLGLFQLLLIAHNQLLQHIFQGDVGQMLQTSSDLSSPSYVINCSSLFLPPPSRCLARQQRDPALGISSVDWNADPPSISISGDAFV